MVLKFEVCYCGDLLAVSDDVKNIDFYRSLWNQYDAEYEFSGAYETLEEWITDLELTPIFE
jgi:hypothetical protein